MTVLKILYLRLHEKVLCAEFDSLARLATNDGSYVGLADAHDPVNNVVRPLTVHDFLLAMNFLDH